MRSFQELKLYFIESLKDQYEQREINSFFFILIENLNNWNKIDFSLRKNEIITLENQLSFDGKINQLKKGVPIQYIINQAYFYNLDLEVNSKVLIPRPETEQLISIINSDFNQKFPLSILDIGTGSGCIILALKSLFKESKCDAIDYSIGAIEVAKNNAKKLDLDVNFSVQDVFKYNSKSKYDIIVSNPPYITESEKTKMEFNVLGFEPHSALFVKDDDPLVFYERIAKIGQTSLNYKGAIYFEINENYGDDVVSLLKRMGYRNCMLKKDLQEKNRFVSATL